MELKGKIALVTGASKGIGKATAELLGNSGCNVIVNYASDQNGADEVVSVLEELGVQAVAIQADISNKSDVESMFSEIKKQFGTLDVLINNAGIFDMNDSPESLEAFENVFKVNFLAQVMVTNEAVKLMKTGKIVFLSSVHGMIGHGRPDAIAYSAMKAGLDSYMKNLAKHLAPDILVNSISPGKTLTPMWGEMDDKTKNEMAQDHLTERWIMPEEIADGILFLLKNDSVCGEILTVDGGMALKTLG
ncbi:SDR family oxidoreductase [Candidatus Dojkabacteria bacterium]|nr:SDR family oxidoreductase [Candidatus Dojkabacteria bacterium]